MDILKTNQKAPFRLFTFFPEKIYPDSYTLKVSYRETNEEPYTGLKIISHNASINPILDWHEIVGEVKNEGTERVTDVEVVCTYYDAEGKVIATETDYLFDVSLSAGDTAPFKLWLFPSELIPSSYDLQVQGMVAEDATPTPTPTATPTATPTPTLTPIPGTGTWHSVITFTGSEDKTTQPFTIIGNEWRVKWSIEGDPDYAYFFVYVYPRSQTSGSVSNWNCDKAPYSDTQYIYEGADDYYFKIGAANLDSWELEVEDYY